MSFNPKPKVRAAIYGAFTGLNLVAVYLFAIGLIGNPEVALVNGLSALAFGLAGINVNPED